MAAPIEVRPPGRCSMRGACGSKGIFSPQLPCPVDAAAQDPDDEQRRSLVALCGQTFAQGQVCCTADQVEALKANLQQAEPLIATCPACANNFKNFFCAFTCSPNQSQFLDVIRTQKMSSPGADGAVAVKEVNFIVGDAYRQSFFDSCKDVKFGASNGFVMDLLGGGAKEPDAFLKFLGDEKPLVGSPFQINFPHAPKDEAPPTQQQWTSYGDRTSSNRTGLPPIPFDPAARSCSDDDLGSRCACTDCPSVCVALPAIPSPVHIETCRVGVLSCFSFSLILLYALAVAAFLAGRGLRQGVKRRKRMGLRHRQSGISISSEGSGYERVRLATEGGGASDESEWDQRRISGTGTIDSAESLPSTARHSGQGLVGATGLGQYDDELPVPPGRGGIGLSASGTLDALGVAQPRSYALNAFLGRFFYHVGLWCARAPWLTFMLAATFVGICNIGWTRFEVETDPVRLWVSPTSDSKLRKEFFDENFGPFYRTQQAFVMDASGAALAKSRVRTVDPLLGELAIDLEAAQPALNWERLKWWADVEAAVRDLRSSPNNLSFSDVCFAPTGRGGPCVVQSVMGYFADDLAGAGVDESNWASALDRCSESPGECLPPFSQPLKRNIVLGGIPDLVLEPVPGGGHGGGEIDERPGVAHDARALVTTWVVQNSLDGEEVKRAMEWEAELERFLFALTGVDGQTSQHPLAVRRRELGVDLAISTEISLEQEIGSSSNTDTGIVILSYILMFLYAALALGGGGSIGNAAAPLNGSTRHPGAGTSASSQSRGGLARVMSFFQRRAAPERSRISHTPLFRRLFIHSKFSLGLFGISIVLASVSSAVGIFSAIGVKVTLVIAEVIPFLVLAVGVDNIFLLQNEMSKQNVLASTNNPYAVVNDSEDAADARRSRQDSYGDDDDSFDNDEADFNASAYHIPSSERAARALSRMGPSILLSAVTQVSAFLLGALVPMPAVRNFALYAAGSMAIAAILQCTAFVAAMALDADRTEASRIDCLPCLRRTPAGAPANVEYAALGIGAGIHSAGLSSEGFLGRFIRKTYAPFLLRRTVKKVVLGFFAGLAVLSLIWARHVSLGLDQRLALPKTSYLRDYFDALDTFLDVGPPVYFVSRGPLSSTPGVVEPLEPLRRHGQQALCGRFTTCNSLSLANTLEGERGRASASFLAEPAASWIDDFMGWLNPVLESCCRVKIKDGKTFCGPSDSEFDCRPCFADREPGWNITMDGLPEGEEFKMYLHQWLRSPTDADCPVGGEAAYKSALSIVGEGVDEHVAASHFRTYHTPLRTQNDFIDALAAAERIAQDVSSRTGLDVFPYSLFYVFFDQYLSIRSLAVRVLGSSLLSIFLTTTLLLGSWRTGAVVTLCVASTLLCILGAMGYLGIALNALTLVNLDVCAAIAVEFCAHVARAFMKAPGALSRSHPLAQKERDERAWAALTDVGASVLSGITGTKLVGISVLAFTRSELLKRYYAQMWFALILVGATHGLVLLPVLLTYLGGRGYGSTDDENEVRRRLLRAQDSAEYRPFVGDVQGIGSDDEEDDDDDDRVAVPTLGR